ncbi:MAG: DUF262 domain-containing protein [Chloroflexota bacterium]|nr:DUF262 domain-containing protein [Chloroflexota bacterium]
MTLIADPLTINKVFSSGGDVQYVLPHFQREYAWEKLHWETLFDDVMEIYDSGSESSPEHFMGALVVIQDGDSRGTMSRFTLVDGQQRLTTISLLLCALKEILAPESRLRGTIEKLLRNPDEEGSLHYKVLPTKKYNDQQAYRKIIDGERRVRSDSGIVKAWNYFKRRLSKEDIFDVDRFFDCVVNGMQVVFIKLDRDDQPYKIFESLNAKGKPLSQADLVRNYIAMKLPADRQETVFNRFWATIDNQLQERRKVARMGELSAFLRHYLAKIYGVLPNENQVYARFRDHMERNFGEVDKFIEELERLHQFAGYYDRLLRPENETNASIRRGIKRLNTIVESVSYPFLLYLYELYTSSKVSDTEFVQALDILENYAIRRFLAGEPTNYLNKMFPTLPRELDDGDFIPSLTSVILTKNYAFDNRIRQNLQLNFRFVQRSRERVILVLKTIDRHLARGSDGYPVLDSDATIEHILPQKPDNTWKEHIGPNWSEVRDEYVNNLGNLTLVTDQWNKELSNGPFPAKKARLARHALRINCDYFSREISNWNIDAILARTEWLTGFSLEIWNALDDFTPPPDVLDSKPISLVIKDVKYPVDSWREVLIKTVRELVHEFENFEDVARRFETHLSRNKDNAFSRSYVLPNGWWLNTGMAASAIYSFCKRYVQAAGLDHREWDVERE